MIRTTKLYFLILIFLTLTTYTSNNRQIKKSIFFQIKNINFEETKLVDQLKMRSDLEFLRGTSLLFIDEKKIIETISHHEFISSVQFKKIYPNTLNIIIFEKKPLAVQFLEGQKFYITKDGSKIKYFKSDKYSNLPTIFGRQENFNLFFYKIKQTSLNVDQIKSFHYFGVGRWDITLNNGKVIKLPEQDYEKILENINNVLNDNNFAEYKIFDYRIIGQLILE